MKTYIYLLSIVLFFVLFFSSPYILDSWQRKSVLEAAGGLPCTEGFVTPILTPCVVSCYPAQTCCTGGTLCTLATAPTCLEQDLSGMSAGGQSCGADYLLTVDQVAIVQGSKNVIIGGTTMNSLSIVASDNGCLGCTAVINSKKFYAFKNTVKSLVDFIVAGIKQ